MFKLYRVLSEYEYSKLRNGILSFKLKNREIRNNKFNTFEYGKSAIADEAYKKHFFLTKEDTFTFNKKCDNEEIYVSVFYVPEELVVKNIGIGNYGDDFFPLEVAISSTEFKEIFNMQPLPSINPKEFLSVSGSALVIEKQQLYSDKTKEYYEYESFMCDILKKFYTGEDGISLDNAKVFFDDEKNREMIVKKIKQIYNY